MGAPWLDRRYFLRSFFPGERPSIATGRAARAYGMEGFHSQPQDVGHVSGFRIEGAGPKRLDCVPASLPYPALEAVGGDDGVLYLHAIFLRRNLAVNLRLDRGSNRTDAAGYSRLLPRGSSRCDPAASRGGNSPGNRLCFGGRSVMGIAAGYLRRGDGDGPA